MSRYALSATITGISGTLIFTGLLTTRLVTPAVYAGLMALLALVSLALVSLPRLAEIDIKNLRMTLSELKQVKAEIEDIYGGIENIRNAKYVLDESKIEALGLKVNKGHIATASLAPALLRYVAGCIKRERERLARVFVNPKDGDRLAEAILDGTYDDLVFRWAGPETTLDKARSG